jgi:hypothetical protein
VTRDGATSNAHGSRLRRARPYVFVAILAIAAYANTLGHPFVYDDSDIARSPLLHDPWNLRAIFNGEHYGPRKALMQLYRPLSDWSCLLNYRANEILFGRGESAFGFHAVDIALHAAVVCLVLASLVAIGLSRRVALIAAILFALHPVHTETVACNVNRSDSQATLFGLAFLLFHARRATAPAAIAYACAMWSKESAAAFFPLAIATDWLSSARAASGESADHERSVARPFPFAAYGVFAAVLALWLGARAWALRDLPPSFTPIDNPLQTASAWERVLTAAAVQARYLLLLVWPVGLSSDYSFDAIRIARSIDDPRVLAFAAVVGLAVLASWRLRRSMPAVALGVIGYAIVFAPTSNFVFPIGTIMAERLAYTPSILFCVLAALALAELRAATTPVVALIACAFLALTVARNRTWSDPLTFCREQIRTSPRSAKAHVNLASALGNAGDDRGALEEYERALAILPDYPGIEYQRGNALHRLNADPSAIVEAYRNAIRCEPSDVNARVNLAWTLLDAGREDEARPIVAEIRALDPRHPILASLEGRLAASRRASTPNSR